MPVIEKLSLSKLDPITHGGALAPRMTDERDAIIKKCAEWRNGYRTLQRLPTATPGLTKKLAEKENDRMKLLVQADTCTARISVNCGYVFAIELAGQIRKYLAKNPGEEKHFLTLWKRPEGTQAELLQQLVAIRILLSMANIVRDLCRPAELNIAIGRRQCQHLMDSLAWCPPAHKHWDRLNSELGGRNEPTQWLKHTVLHLACGDVEKFEKMLVRDYSSGSWVGNGIDWSTADDRKKFVKGCVVEKLSEVLMLGTLKQEVKTITGTMIADGTFPDPQQAKLDGAKALKGLRMKFWIDDFHPDWKAKEITLDENNFEESLNAMIRKFGYASIDETAGPSDLADMI